MTPLKKRVTISLFLLGVILLGLFDYKYDIYRISTGSMEPTLSKDDLVLVDRTKKAKGDIERNGIYTFRFPMEDTIISGYPEVYYGQFIRNYAKKNNVTFGEARTSITMSYELESKDLDKRTLHLLRIIALPGDKLEIIDSEVFIDHKPIKEVGDILHNYKVTTRGKLFNENEFSRENISDYRILSSDKFGTTIITLKASDSKKLEQANANGSLQKIIHPMGYGYSFSNNPIFPNSNSCCNWSRDNFGPIVVPREGDSIVLNKANLEIYKRIIGVYEGNSLQITSQGHILVNGKRERSYIFKKDYYWVMGDNRHNSLDSRFWGFVPADHINGKLVSVLFNFSWN